MTFVQYVPKNQSSGRPLGICDRSGLLFYHDQLKKQMVYVGDKLVWNGMLVGYPYLDVPVKTNAPIPIKEEPKPVKNPRPRVHENIKTNSEILSDLQKNSFLSGERMNGTSQYQKTIKSELHEANFTIKPF